MEPRQGCGKRSLTTLRVCKVMHMVENATHEAMMRDTIRRGRRRVVVAKQRKAQSAMQKPLNQQINEELCYLLLYLLSELDQ